MKMIQGCRHLPERRRGTRKTSCPATIVMDWFGADRESKARRGGGSFACLCEWGGMERATPGAGGKSGCSGSLRFEGVPTEMAPWI